MVSPELSSYASRLSAVMVRRGSDFDFEAWALELFRLQYAHNPAYARICRAQACVPESVRCARDIPVVPTFAFKEWDMTSLPPEARTAVFHSSGTTVARPSRHHHWPASLALYDLSARTWFLRHFPTATSSGGVTKRVWSLTPPPACVPTSSLVHMFAGVGCWMGATSTAFLGRLNEAGDWCLEIERWKEGIELANRDQQPVILLGTAFLFVHLLDALASMPGPFVLPEGSMVLETGGYKGRSRAIPREELHRSLSRGLGVPLDRIVCEYGMSELSSQAYAILELDSERSGVQEPSHSGLRRFRFPPWVRWAVISPETGREIPDGMPGLLRVWDLANVWSVMGIQTEDVATSMNGAFELHGRSPAASPRGCSLMAA
ncbi:MAG: hypothetical protein JNK85_11895 [Verrucomicrobiales bacterium]|nr:hypothetical protein [Verrucomicrobiales bacterium]